MTKIIGAKPQPSPHLIRPTDGPTCPPPCNGRLKDQGYDPQWNAYALKCERCGNLVRVRSSESPRRDPLDPTRYLAGAYSLQDVQRALIEQWAFNHRRDYGRRMRIPVALYDTLRTSGVNVTNLEPEVPKLF